jgi:biopolymer transport protein ExbD
MPVKLGDKLGQESAEARIEIVPLIDIMFFLLAAFMLVSLSMVSLKSMKVNLPTATAANTDTKKDIVDVSIDKSGAVYLDKRPVRDDQVTEGLAAMKRTNPQVRVFISGDRDARYGAVVHALDLVRSAGIDKVAFEIQHNPSGKTP